MDLHSLILEYRKGRDGFDGLAVAAAQMYASGELFPPLGPDEEISIKERLLRLSADDLDRALAGQRGLVALSREEYWAILEDVIEFLKAWQADELAD